MLHEFAVRRLLCVHVVVHGPPATGGVRELTKTATEPACSSPFRPTSRAGRDTRLPYCQHLGEHWYCLSLAQSVEKFLSRERKLMQVAHGYSQASADVRLLCGQLYRSRFSCQRIRPLRSQEAPSRFESVLVN
ncbi:hypothetical protein HRbin28_00442 [bacterium HR28]|nr:hypothetical protein HRbin28_00442 [bacterium HR28]